MFTRKYITLILITLLTIGCSTESSLRLVPSLEWKTIDIKSLFKMAVPMDAIGKNKRQYERAVWHLGSRKIQFNNPVETYRAEFKNQSMRLKIEWAPGVDYLDPPEVLPFMMPMNSEEEFRIFMEEFRKSVMNPRKKKFIKRRCEDDSVIWFLPEDGCYAIRFRDRYHSNLPVASGFLVKIWTDDPELAERIFCSIQIYQPADQQFPHKLNRGNHES
jgi:hypothetical protein